MVEQNKILKYSLLFNNVSYQQGQSLLIRYLLEIVDVFFDRNREYSIFGLEYSISMFRMKSCQKVLSYHIIIFKLIFKCCSED